MGMKPQKKWLPNALMSVFLTTTSLTTLGQDTAPTTKPNNTQPTTTIELPQNNYSTIQLTPDLKISTKNFDLIADLYKKTLKIDAEYETVNNKPVPDFMRRPVYLSELLTGSPHDTQIEIMATESGGFTQTDNATSSGLGYGQFMRLTTMYNAMMITENKFNDDVTRNIQPAFPKEMKVLHSIHLRSSRAARITFTDPDKLSKLTQDQQRLLINQNEPINHWDDTLNEDTAFQKLAIINPETYESFKEEHTDLQSDLQEKQKAYRRATSPTSAITLEEFDLLYEQAQIAYQNTQDFNARLIKETVDEYTRLVHKAEDIELTNDFHNAVNHNITVSTLLLGWHTHNNIKEMQRQEIPVSKNYAYDAHFNGVGGAIAKHKELMKNPDNPSYMMFSNSREEAEEKYGHIIFNEINRSFFLHPDNEDGTHRYKTIKEMNDYTIDVKGYDDQSFITLGEADTALTEAIKNSDIEFILTSQELTRLYSKIESYAQKVDNIKYKLDNPTPPKEELEQSPEKIIPPQETIPNAPEI